ncbi:ABCF2, partial [Symbiodinium microadriaticum]
MAPDSLLPDVPTAPISNPLIYKASSEPREHSPPASLCSEKSVKLGKKASASQRVQHNVQELESELEDARVNAARTRSLQGAYKGALECSNFTLPNPGGGIPLLENATCTLVRGRRYGLIGRNGKGKSTMLRALAARRVGNIPANVTVHYVSQEVELTEVTRQQTPVDCVLAADVERRVLLDELAQLDEAIATDSLDENGRRRHMEVIEQLDLINADSADRRAVELLKNLGFSDELRARTLEDLSGGWRVRAMLAAAIFARPDLLLLDEPTNHLSILAVMWLTRELSTAAEWQERIVVVVSHDRFFIDEVCTDVLHISGVARRLTQSHGNYSTW